MTNIREPCECVKKDLLTEYFKGMCLCSADDCSQKEPKNNRTCCKDVEMIPLTTWLPTWSLLFLLWKHLILHLNSSVFVWVIVKAAMSVGLHCLLFLHGYSCQRVVVWVWWGEAGRLRCGGTADRHADQKGDVCRYTVLDGPGGHPAVCLWLEGTSLWIHSHLKRFIHQQACVQSQHYESKRFQNHTVVFYVEQAHVEIESWTCCDANRNY